MDRRDFPARARLGGEFFAHPTLEVARRLVGCVLVHDDPEGLVALRIVEVEAYLGEGEDPASHAHRGRTPRNGRMFETPGRLYVYLSYGLHHCLNVVTEPAGCAGAVLLRAGVPLAGEALLRRRRGRGGRDLSNGPGKLGQALGADLGWDGRSLLRGPLGIWPGPDRVEVRTSGRIGIRLAAERPYRFFDASARALARPRGAL